MKSSATALLLFLGKAHAQNDAFTSAFEVVTGAANIDKALESYIQKLSPEEHQPSCMHPTDNYVMCMDKPDDIEDTQFLIHPLVPGGTSLSMLKGTTDYDLGKGMIQAFRDALCEDTGGLVYASYPWLSSDDHQTMIKATSLVKDSSVQNSVFLGERELPIMCATGPLAEDPLEEMVPEPVEVMAPTKMHDLIPEFIWSPAPEGADYDFVGNLEMCGGKATKMEWPRYFVNEEISGAVFAYRQWDNHQGLECGEEMAPVMHLIPGKRYKINFINSSESDTNLHSHGLHIGGNGWSDDVFRTIPAGMCGVYFWELIPDHISGMHWYHPHLHEWTFEQVRGRAFGPIFVDEPAEVHATYPVSVQKWLESTVLLQMSTETVPSPMTNGDGVKDGRCPGGFDECYPRANNKRQEQVTLVKGEWHSVVLHNVVPNGTGMDVVKFYDSTGLGEAPCEIMIAGYDGVYRSSVPRPVEDYPEEPGYFHCNGASRLQLAMRCTDDATMKLGKEESNAHHYGMDVPEEAALMPILVVFNVIDGEVTEASPYADEATLTPWIPPRPFYLEDLTTWDGEVETWEIVTDVAGMGTGDPNDLQPIFNGKVFHGGDANHIASYGKVQEWSYFGSGAHPDGHPMHVHVNHVQIYGHSNTTGIDCGPNLEFGQWYDTVRIKNMDWDPCLARFRFNDYSGKVIMHCHDLLHEDAGMMGWVKVVGGPQDEIADAPVKEPIECTNVL